MAVFRHHLPSRHNLYLLFAACLLPVHVRAILRLLAEFPSLMLRMTPWEVVAAAAYTLTFALFESLLILLGIALLTTLMPPRWLVGSFAVRGTLLMCSFLPWFYVTLSVGAKMGRVRYLLLTATYALLLLILRGLLRRQRGVVALLEAFLERLSILAYLYFTLDLLGLLIVLARNA